MAARCVAGRSLVADQLALLDLTAGLDPARERVRLHVGVPGLEIAGVDDDHDPGRVGAVGVIPADVADSTGPGGPDRLAAATRCHDVDPVVVVGAAVARPVAGVRAAAVLA